MTSSRNTAGQLLLGFAVATAVAACAPASDKADASATTAITTMTPRVAADSTPDADRQFLRMMSDHHKGLIEIVHMTQDRTSGGPEIADAKMLDAAQDKQLDDMVTMLEKEYKDPYSPSVMPEHRAMLDALKGKSGKDYSRTFYQDIIKHHEEALAMIDAYLPNAKSATVKQMAEMMKTMQAKEVATFGGKLKTLGG